MSRYIDRPNLDTLPQPLSSNNMCLYAFFCKSDRKILNTILEPVNVAGTDSWQAMSEYVIITLASWEVRSLRQPYSHWGYFAEQEAAFWIIAEFENQISLYAPYMFSNNGVLLNTWRETLGLPKQWGNIQFTRPPQLALQVETSVISTFTPTTTAQYEKIIQIEALTDITTTNLQESTLAEFLPEKILTYPSSLSLLALKQFRDMGLGETAIYQKVVLIPIQAMLKEAKQLHGDLTIHLKSSASHPFNTDLGLPPTLTPNYSFQLKLDLLLGSPDFAPSS